MSAPERPRVIRLADRRPDGEDETVHESIAILEAALAAIRKGEAREVIVLTGDGDRNYGLATSFEDVGDALLATAYLDDFIRDWRNSGE